MEPTTTPNAAIETIRPLCGLLMYEDRETHARALNLYAHLAIEIASDIPIEFTWWAMPSLQSAEHTTAAREAVLQADMVIIAAHPASDWPPAFKAWIESWRVPAESRLCALGALFLPVTNHLKNWRGRQNYLENIAARLHLDFLTSPADSTGGNLKSKFGFTPAAPLAPTEVHPAPERPDYSPYCGING